MENVKFETCCQIIIHFYQNYEAKGKPYTVTYFAEMNVPQRFVAHHRTSISPATGTSKGKAVGG